MSSSVPGTGLHGDLCGPSRNFHYKKPDVHCSQMVKSKKCWAIVALERQAIRSAIGFTRLPFADPLESVLGRMASDAAIAQAMYATRTAGYAALCKPHARCIRGRHKP